MISGYIEEMGKKAKEASKKLLTLDTGTKNRALVMIAEELINKKEEIKEANRIDLENGKKEGLSFALLDRLELTDKRIEAMSQGLIEIAAFTDPIGEILTGWKHKNGMTIEKKKSSVRCTWNYIRIKTKCNHRFGRTCNKIIQCSNFKRIRKCNKFKYLFKQAF